MKQVFIGREGVRVDEVPAPVVRAGELLVATMHSSISVGTEVSGVRSASAPIWKRVLKEPQKLKAVIAAMRKEGWARTRRLVQTKLDSQHPIGYSAAGRVLAVGAGVEGFEVGDLVACGGSQCAYHAEVVAVPRNLAVPLPAGVSTRDASTVAIGAIALQGVRRAAPTLGETFVVIGLGLLGQLTQQLLRAHGARVIGIDPDAQRVQRALALGMAHGWSPSQVESIAQVMRLAGGAGADGVIVTASSASSEIVSEAFRMCRRKARVVLVGDVGLDLRRGDIYEKELDFLVSSSYGPGRYDAQYEQRGIDYPIAYVRWTENRNMLEYLRLVAEGRVDVGALIDSEVPLQRAADAYRALAGTGGEKPLGVVLRYDAQPLPGVRRVDVGMAPRGTGAALRVGVIGTGGFAQSTLLPIVADMKGRLQIRGVVSRQGHNAVAIARQYAGAYATTDAAELLADPDIDAVVIATRHDDHASRVLAALEAGKHVFVEKPLCLTADELARIESCVATLGDRSPLLMTGFNRRFSPYARELRGLLAGRSGPLALQYTVNAGYIPASHWVHGPEGGGRNLGEACHFYDLLTCLTDARVVSVSAQAIRPRSDHYRADDNFIATLRFDDGSIATLFYSAMGSNAVSKERLEVFWDGKIAQLDDFRELTVHGATHKPLRTAVPQKGHIEEFAQWHDAIATGGAWPIPFWQQVQASRIALDVQAQLQAGVSA